MGYLNICGPEIRKARLAKGWTQAELARQLAITELGLTPAAISQIERQRRRVDDEALSLIAVALDVSINTLVPTGER